MGKKEKSPLLYFLLQSLLSSDGLFVTLQRTADGKDKAVVAPEGMPPSFFLRVKMK